MYGLGETNQNSIAEAEHFSKIQFQVVNEHLEKQDYLAGELSIADFCAYAYVEQVNVLNISLVDYPKLSSWLQRMATHPAIDAAQRLFK